MQYIARHERGGTRPKARLRRPPDRSGMIQRSSLGVPKQCRVHKPLSAC